MDLNLGPNARSTRTFTSFANQISNDLRFRALDSAFDDGVEVALETRAPGDGETTQGAFIDWYSVVVATRGSAKGWCTCEIGATMLCWESWMGAMTVGTWASGIGIAKPRGASIKAACIMDENVIPQGDIDEG
ncbi:hypothetical protein L7F22_018654 [Adiantum nelumboides]|nr:hypothetical protein [Adiantum nelumboides]